MADLITDDHCSCTAATAWRMLAASEHVLDLLAEWSTWDRRRADRQVSGAFAGGLDWRLRAGAPTYAELQRRRDHYDNPPRTAEQIHRDARASWGSPA